MFTMEQTMQEAGHGAEKYLAVYFFLLLFHMGIAAYYGVHEETVSTEVKLCSESGRD